MYQFEVVDAVAVLAGMAERVDEVAGQEFVHGLIFPRGYDNEVPRCPKRAMNPATNR